MVDTSINEVFDKYYSSNPEDKVGLKKPIGGLTAVSSAIFVGNKEPSGLQPGELCIDKSSGVLLIGTANNGPEIVPIPVPNPELTVFGGPASIGYFQDSISVNTSYTQSTRNFEIPVDLNTKDLMFIKDKIEYGYSYIKIKNLDELRQAFRRLGCYVTDFDVSAIATVGVFPLPSGKYVVIN